MSFLTKKQHEWLLRHAEKKENGWFCRKTGVTVRCMTVRRAMRTRPFNPHDPEKSIKVLHLYCPGCTTNYRVPEYGASVYEDELIEIEHQSA